MNISLDTMPEIVFVAEEHIPKLNVTVNKVAVDKDESKARNHLDVRSVAKAIKQNCISTGIQ